VLITESEGAVIDEGHWAPPGRAAGLRDVLVIKDQPRRRAPRR
jgi:hypothetical protein